MSKKIILCILIILTIFLVSSCRDDTEQEKNGNINTDADKSTNNNTPKEVIMEDWYFFRTYDGGIYGNDNRPVKINPVSEKAAFVCADSLCMHEEDCPFFECMDSYVIDNYVFYVKASPRRFEDTRGAASRDLCVYDMLNNSIRLLAEYEDQLYILSGTGNYLYYCIEEYNESYSSSIKYLIYRANAKTGNIMQIGEYIDIYPNIYTITNDKIYWWKPDVDNENIIYYTTDLDIKNETTIGLHENNTVFMLGKHDNGYIYYTDWDSEKLNQLSGYEYDYAWRNQKLYRIPLNSSGKAEPEIITESIINFVPCGDKIYYTVLEETPEVVKYNGVQTYNWSGGKIYVMDSDGTDQKLLCETEYVFSDIFGYASLGRMMEVKTINGVDYLGLSFYIAREYMFLNYGPSPDTLIINASTGEYTVVSVPE